MKIALVHMLLAILALTLSACAQTPPTSTQGALTISGRSAPSELGLLFTNVRAVRAGTVIAEVPVGLDGSFSLRVPAGHGYLLEFTHDGGASTLIFPRQAGSLEHRFDVLGHGTFDLGTVRHIGDPALHSFRFSSAQAALTSTDSAPVAGDADGVECEDGVDAATGAVCVDDDAMDEGSTCGEDEDSAADDSAETDGVDCEDGIDSATGAECDGGPSANPTGGADEDPDGADTEDDAPADAAVADHNLPASAGCGADTDDDDIECENGIDPTTGAECDGGPEANADDGTET